MKKKIIPFTVALIALILCFTLPAAAAKVGAPQDMDGLQVADIQIYLGDLTTPISPSTFDSDITVRTTAYTSGLDIAEIITDFGTMSFTKARIVFTWNTSDGLNVNSICLKNVPSDFKITVSGTGTSAMTGQSYSQGFNYVDQQDGWYRYDTFSTSATQTPVFSNLTSLSITIDGGSALLSTLGDDDIILSLSMLPYNLNAASDLQYNLGYQDAQKVYKDILQQEKQNSYDAGVLKGYQQGYNQADADLWEVYYDQGYDDGYAEGKADGMSIAENGDLRDLVFAIPEAHLTALEGFTNWNLLGYNLYDLLGGLTTLVIVAALFMIGIKFIL